MTTIKSNYDPTDVRPRKLDVTQQEGHVHLYVQKDDHGLGMGIQVSLAELLAALAADFPEYEVTYKVPKQIPEPPTDNLAVIKFDGWVPVIKSGKTYRTIATPNREFTWERLLDFIGVEAGANYKTLYKGV